MLKMLDCLNKLWLICPPIKFLKIRPVNFEFFHLWRQINGLTERIYSAFLGEEVPKYCLLEQSFCFQDTTPTICHWCSEYPCPFQGI